jgi:hypothetical protein
VRIDGTHLLDGEQRAASHVAITSPARLAGKLVLAAREEAAHQSGVHNCRGLRMDQLIEPLEVLILDKWNADALDHRCSGARACIRHAATVHRSRGLLAAVLQPKIQRAGTGGIEESEVFEAIRDETGDLDEFVIVSGPILLQIAERNFGGLFGEGQGGECEQCEKEADHRADGNASAESEQAAR